MLGGMIGTGKVIAKGERGEFGVSDRTGLKEKKRKKKRSEGQNSTIICYGFIKLVRAQPRKQGSSLAEFLEEVCYLDENGNC